MVAGFRHPIAFIVGITNGGRMDQLPAISGLVDSMLRDKRLGKY